jgi:hypothetical protein
MKPRGVAWNGRGQLSDRFAVAARELLAHSLDHLPLAQDDLQCLGDILAELGQFRRSPSRTTDRSRNDDALSRDIVAKRFADWPLALERAHQLGLLRGFRRDEFVLRRGGFDFLELQFHLLEKSGLALRALPYISRRSFSISSLR